MNSKHTPSSSDFKFQLNPNAKEFVPASSRSSAGGSARRQKPEPLVIRDKESDKAFHQRLKESRDFWDLKKVPSYKKLKCATCTLDKHPKPKNHIEMLKELTHDVVNLVAYYHDCEDKEKEYECKYCVDKFNGVVDPEDERYPVGYACPDQEECGCNDCENARCDYSSDEDYSYDEEDDDDEEDNEDSDERRARKKLERKRAKAYKRRNQREHMRHLKEEHERKLKIILHFKQDFIPLCGESGFFYGEYGLDEVFRCMNLNKGHKFLHMVEPPRPRSPGSPKAWQYMMGMEDDDYDMYNYENEWQSPRKESIKEMLRKALCRMDSDIDDDEVIDNTRRLYDMFNERDSSDSDY